MAIDWQYQTDCYNRDNKTNFQTPRSLLKALYKKLGACKRVAAILFISPQSVFLKMKAEKIKLNLKGHQHPTRCEVAILKLFKAQSIEGMTAKQIATKIKFSENYTRAVLERTKIKYKKNWIRKKLNAKQPTN